MKTDRELLELAAKAAGIDAVFVCTEYETCMKVPYSEGNSSGFKEWNPLESDGDALRLAVKLELSIRHRTVDVDISGIKSASEYVPTYRNRETATRRAIVRAAAAIGEGIIGSQPASHMPEDNYEKTQAEAFYGEKK